MNYSIGWIIGYARGRFDAWRCLRLAKFYLTGLKVSARMTFWFDRKVTDLLEKLNIKESP